jgi:post-segregation antitoxin (ccd killing protein)
MQMPKIAASFLVEQSVLDDAKRLSIDTEAVVETSLRRAIAEHDTTGVPDHLKAWAEENKAVFEEHARRDREDGFPNDDLRMF